MCPAKLILALLAPLVAGPLAAQRGFEDETLPNGFRLRRAFVEGCGQQALVLLWPVGAEADPKGRSGLAQAVAELLTLQGRAGLQVRGRVHGRFTAIHLTVDVSRVEEAADLLGELLEAGAAPDADRVARAIARAALRADDALSVLPGPVLRSRARAAMLAGTPGARPVGGRPEEILTLDGGSLFERLRECYGPAGAILATVGGAADRQWQAARQRLAAVPPRAGQAPQPVAETPPPAEAFTRHRLVDGPFVAAALPAPDPGDPAAPAFALAMELLRSRALLVFREYRGAEHRARFPFVDYDLAAGDRLVLVGRRGRDGDPVGAPRREIEELLQGLAQRPPRFDEIARAARLLSLQLGLPPYESGVRRSLVEVPSGLLPRALALALHARWQWPDDFARRLPQVPGAEVERALAAALAPERWRWFGLLPGGPAAADGAPGR